MQQCYFYIGVNRQKDKTTLKTLVTNVECHHDLR